MEISWIEFSLCEVRRLTQALGDFDAGDGQVMENEGTEIID